MKIAVIGSCMTDLVTYADDLPGAGETVVAREFATGFGGKGANQAVAAARLGADVAMVACVGDDRFGDDTLENFRQQGMAVDGIRRESGISSGVASIWVDAASENRILIVPGANERLSPAVIAELGPTLRDCGLMVLQLEIPLETVYAAVDAAARFDVPVLLNPAPAQRGLQLERLRGVRYLVPNESELALLTGLPVDSAAAVEAAAGRILGAGIEHVIVTLGAEGALWASGDTMRHFAAPAVAAVDSTGAGDAFIGCFAAGLAAGRSIAAAIERAVRYASSTVTAKGTQASYQTADAFARAEL